MGDVQTLHTDGKLSWDSGNLDGIIEIVRDATDTYVAFRRLNGSLIRLQ